MTNSTGGTERRHGFWSQTSLMLAGLILTTFANAYWFGGEFGRLKQAIVSLEAAVMRPEFDSKIKSLSEKSKNNYTALDQKIEYLSTRIDDHFSHHGDIEKKLDRVRVDLLRKMEKMEDKIFSLIKGQ